MKTMALILIGFFISSCEYLAVTNPVCNKLVDVKGFTGDFEWSFPEAGTIPVKVIRKKKGIYSLRTQGEEMFEYKTCKFGKLLIAESQLISDDGNDIFYQALRLTVNRSQVKLKSIQFKEEVLTSNGIPYEFDEDVIDGFTITGMVVDNSNISANNLVKLRSKTYERQPFEIILDR